jgi:hypothetical protein
MHVQADGMLPACIDGTVTCAMIMVQRYNLLNCKNRAGASMHCMKIKSYFNQRKHDSR